MGGENHRKRNAEPKEGRGSIYDYHFVSRKALSQKIGNGGRRGARLVEKAERKKGGKTC